MESNSPLVSVLITTYKRPRLVRRAIESVLKQSFRDYEIVVIDDCSPDDTGAVVAGISDPRIRYVRNATNVGSIYGDRAHVRRFVYELMRGKYFVYLCDDDYWLPSDLLERQVKLFGRNPGLAFVFGNQLSYFLTTPESYFGGTPESTLTLTRENLAPYFDFAALHSKSPHLGFYPHLFPKEVMTSEEFLEIFASEPTTYNRIVGSTLYSRDHFIEAGAMRTPQGSTWQAGYEFLMGPACVGGVAYIDEPAIVTEIRGENASFRRTQVEHYLDAIKSLELAFAVPMAEAPARQKRFLRHVRAKAVRNLSRAFLRNTATIRREGALGMCSAENIAKPVTPKHVLPVFARNGVWPGRFDLAVLYCAQFTAPRSMQQLSGAKAFLRRLLPE